MTRRPDRYYNDKGQVGYIVSTEYGCGWYTDNGDEYPDCATDPELVAMVAEAQQYIVDNRHTLGYEVVSTWEALRDGVPKDATLYALHKRIKAYANEKWPNGHWSFHSLTVNWGYPNDFVKFSVFDGAESAYAYAPEDTLVL